MGGLSPEPLCKCPSCNGALVQTVVVPVLRDGSGAGRRGEPGDVLLQIG